MLRTLLDLSYIAKHFRHVREQLDPDIRMCVLPPAQPNGELDFIAFFQEAASLVALHLDIMVVGIRLHPNLFELDDLLVLACFALLLGLVIAELAVIHQPAHRRVGIRRNLDKVQTTLLSHLLSLESRHDTYLLAQFIDQANLRYTNAPINTCF